MTVDSHSKNGQDDGTLEAPAGTRMALRRIGRRVFVDRPYAWGVFALFFFAYISRLPADGWNVEILIARDILRVDAIPASATPTAAVVLRPSDRGLVIRRLHVPRPATFDSPITLTRGQPRRRGTAANSNPTIRAGSESGRSRPPQKGSERP